MASYHMCSMAFTVSFSSKIFLFTSWYSDSQFALICLMLDETLTSFFRSSMALVEEATRNADGSNCITFVPRTTEKTYIKVINGSGCWSFVGMQLTEGVQELSLKIPGCMVRGTVAHEFIHALGFWHEQSRPDRDEFIEVVWDKISEANRHNFNKYSTDLVDLLDLPYDYGSVMHYGDKGFSIDGSKTIVVKQPGATIGQRVNLSPIDDQEIRKYYGCN